MIALARLPDPETLPEAYDDTPTKRALAWLLDGAVIFALTALTVPLTLFASLFFLPMVWLAIGFAYRTTTLARGSATWGMRLMAIEIRDHRGGRLDLGTAAAHTALYYAAMAMVPLQIVSVALMLTTPRRQGLSDLALGTAAVNAMD